MASSTLTALWNPCGDAIRQAGGRQEPPRWERWRPAGDWSLSAGILTGGLGLFLELAGETPALPGGTPR